jgi:hypothetical protein
METVEEITEALEDRIRGANAALDEARQAFKALEAETRQLTKALAALSPNSPLLAKNNGKPARRKGGRDRRGKLGVGEETIGKVHAHMEALGTPTTVQEVSSATGITDVSVRSALQELRRREQIRMAGRRNGVGRPRLYQVMP